MEVGEKTNAGWANNMVLKPVKNAMQIAFGIGETERFCRFGLLLLCYAIAIPRWRLVLFCSGRPCRRNINRVASSFHDDTSGNGEGMRVIGVDEAAGNGGV